MKINRSCKITIQKYDWIEEDKRSTSYVFYDSCDVICLEAATTVVA